MKLVFLLLIIPSLCSAEIYSWKDENGKTVFSDRKPDVERKVKTVSEAGPAPGKWDQEVQILLQAERDCERYPNHSFEYVHCMNEVEELKNTLLSIKMIQ